jgi:hypothetical protein
MMMGERFESPTLSIRIVKLAGSPGRMIWLDGVFVTRIFGFQGCTVTSAEAFHWTIWVYPGPYAFAFTQFV